MNDNVIYNCHTHIFTHENIPNGLFPLGLVRALRVRPLRWALKWTMKGVIPFTKRDSFHRFAAMINAAYRETQENNLIVMMDYYPDEPKTKFIILPMDMAHMGAGKVKVDIDAQHAKLAELANMPKYKDILIPFAHIDPRRTGPFNRVQSLVEEHNFRGVKIYPCLGYGPNHEVLMRDIYPYMVRKNIPLLAHCSPGAINSRDMSPKQAHACAEPNNYKIVMETFPDLRICLGHFGGIGEWKRHINEPRDEKNPTWLKKICDLITSGNYPNLYADISFTIFNFQENVPLLKILLEDKVILEHVLFGSDFYMSESRKYSEKRLSTDLRSELGEDKFWQIAHENPRVYLGI